MTAWTRWQHLVALVAGVYAALSPIWVDTTHEGGAIATLITLGALLVLTALVGLARPGLVAAEWAIALWGVLLFVAPWVITYTGLTGAEWTSWIVGAIGFVAGLGAVPMTTSFHRRAIQH